MSLIFCGYKETNYVSMHEHQCQASGAEQHPFANQPNLPLLLPSNSPIPAALAPPCSLSLSPLWFAWPLSTIPNLLDEMHQRRSQPWQCTTLTSSPPRPALACEDWREQERQGVAFFLSNCTVSPAFVNNDTVAANWVMRGRILLSEFRNLLVV